MVKKLNPCDVYIALYCMFLLQDVIYPSGILNQLISLVLIVWSLSLSLKYILNFKYSPPLLNATSLLVLMYTCYGLLAILYDVQYRFVIHGIVGDYRAPYVYLRDSLTSLLPIYFFYHFSRRGSLDGRRIRAYFFVFLAIYIINYFHNYQKMLLDAITKDSGIKEFTNNVGYSFLSLIPLLFFFYKKPVMQYILLLVLMGFILSAMKRGAILISVLCFFWLLISNVKRETDKVRKSMTILLCSVMVAGALGYYTYMKDNSPYFRERIELTKKGYTSGRDILQGKIKNAIVYDTSISHLILGRGAQSTIGIAGNYAHNDWFETMCNNGLLGVSVLIFFYVALFILAWCGRSYLSQPMYNCLMMLVATCLLPTVFSMSIQGMQLTKNILIGYFLALSTQHNKWAYFRLHDDDGNERKKDSPLN